MTRHKRAVSMLCGAPLAGSLSGRRLASIIQRATATVGVVDPFCGPLLRPQALSHAGDKFVCLFPFSFPVSFGESPPCILV